MKALATAQVDTFKKRAYGFRHKLWGFEESEAANEWPVPNHKTIEEAREDCEADGTCSVLDVLDLASKPGFEAAGPFSEEELVEIVGTAKPSEDELGEKLGDLFELLGRGESAYVICYTDGAPATICFLGMSAD